jgi:hypothetical protein
VADEHDHLDEVIRTGGCEDHEDPAWVVAHDNYRLLSVNVNLRIGDLAFAERLRWLLEPFIQPKLLHESVIIDVGPLEDAVHPDDPWWAYDAQGPDEFVGTKEAVLNRAVWHVHSLVQKRTADFLLLHASAVARDGTGILLPAARDTGKSTLAAALLREGFRYLSDELGAIDPVTRRAYPFPKRITLDEESLAFFPGLAGRLEDRTGIGEWLYQRYARPEDLDSSVSGPVVIGALVFPSMDREGPARLVEMPRAAAVEEMARQCFNLFRYGPRGVKLFADIANDAKSYRLEGGTPPERARAVADELG